MSLFKSLAVMMKFQWSCELEVEVKLITSHITVKIFELLQFRGSSLTFVFQSQQIMYQQHSEMKTIL